MDKENNLNKKLIDGNAYDPLKNPRNLQEWM